MKEVGRYAGGSQRGILQALGLTRRSATCPRAGRRYIQICDIIFRYTRPSVAGCATAVDHLAAGFPGYPDQQRRRLWWSGLLYGAAGGLNTMGLPSVMLRMHSAGSGLESIGWERKQQPEGKRTGLDRVLPTSRRNYGLKDHSRNMSTRAGIIDKPD